MRGQPRAFEKARWAMAEQDCFVSFASFWEIMRCASLPGHRRDPFDRMLVAQAQEEKLAIVSRDSIFDSYGVKRFW
jgi:PIN domain nuclease of toxin-antitoxin system